MFTNARPRKPRTDTSEAEHRPRTKDGSRIERVLPNIAIVPVGEINDAARRALDAAFTIGADRVIAVHVCDLHGQSATREFELEWDSWNRDVNMVLLDGRAFSVATPIVDYVRRTSVSRPASTGPLRRSEIIAAAQFVQQKRLVITVQSLRN